MGDNLNPGQDWNNQQPNQQQPNQSWNTPQQPGQNWTDPQNQQQGAYQQNYQQGGYQQNYQQNYQQGAYQQNSQQGGYQQPYNNGYQQPYNNGYISPKSRTTFGVLALLIGGIGVQYFYVNKVAAGLLCILISIVTCGLWSFVTFIQGIIVLASMSDYDFEQKFVYSNSTFPIF